MTRAIDQAHAVDNRMSEQPKRGVGRPKGYRAPVPTIKRAVMLSLTSAEWAELESLGKTKSKAVRALLAIARAKPSE